MISKSQNAAAKLFIKSIKDLTPKEQKEQCKALIEYLKSKYVLSTVRGVLTHYRKLAKKELINLDAYLSISKAENNKIEKAYTKKIATQHKNLVQIKDMDGLINKAIEVLESSVNPYELTAAVCLLSGRRMVEVVKVGRFFNHNYTIYQLKFKGQAKKKDDDKESFAIPTLCHKDLIKSAVKTIREKLQPEKLTNNQVNRKFETSVNMTTNKLFNAFLGRCTCHSLRKAYATICEYKYKHSKQSTNSYLAEILGHSENDLTTSNSYQFYYI